MDGSDGDSPAGQLANLTVSDEAFNPDVHSPNDMMIDSEEHIVEPTANGLEKDNLAIIDPNNLDNEQEQLQDLPVATDRELSLGPRGCPMPTSRLLRYANTDTDDAMRDIVLPPLNEEPKILEDAVFTWTVEGWRSLAKKEHGPVFQAGGFPWYV